ncbi:MAG: hypothetical protein AB9836_10010, partial [Aminipila sp.]
FFVRRFNESNLTVNELIIKADYAMVWKEVLKEDCSKCIVILKERVTKMLKESQINLAQLQKIIIDPFDYNIQSITLKENLNDINDILLKNYFITMFLEFEKAAVENNFSVVLSILELMENEVYNYSKYIRKYFDCFLKEGFLLTGNVSDDKCRCFRKIVKIAKVLDAKNFNEYISLKMKEYAQDKMFVHRTRQVIEERS